MLEIDNNKERNITFEVSLSGINPQDLEAHFRILIDGIEYGFPAYITESSILVTIPSLKNIIHRPLREDEKLPSKLDIFGSDHYFNPWSGEVKIKNTVMLEARIVESNDSKKPTVKASIVSKINSKKTTSKETIKEEKEIKPIVPVKKTKVDPKDITMEHLEAFMKQNGTKDKKIQKIILETCITRVGDSNLKELFKELFRYYKREKISAPEK